MFDADDNKFKDPLKVIKIINEDNHEEVDEDSKNIEDNKENEDVDNKYEKNIVDAPKTLSVVSKILSIISVLLIVIGICIFSYNVYVSNKKK